MMKLLLAGVLALLPLTAQAESLGNLSANEFDPNSVANLAGAGIPNDPDSVINDVGPYGNPYSPSSATNFEAITALPLYDRDGNDQGWLSTNLYDPDWISNPYGRYGNPYSPNAIDNRYGTGNPCAPSSPTNPYGQDWRIDRRR
jgi:hypothetical protein